MSLSITEAVSSCVNDATYDGEGTLFIAFDSGHKYEYYLVPLHVATELIAKLSNNDQAGDYFNSYVRDVFGFSRLV